MKLVSKPLHLNSTQFRDLLEQQGPSLGLWRAAEIAVLSEQTYEPPVLDLGCGDGLVTSQVLNRVAMGVDPDGKALHKAWKRGVYAQLQAVPVEKVPLPPESVGTILSNSVLEHIPNIGEVLLAANRLLRPGGSLIFTVPTEAFSRWLFLPFPGYARRRNRQFQHINLWPLSQWNDCLEQAGFEVELVRPYLRPSLVRLWDLLELLQEIYIARERLVKRIWRRMTPETFKRMAAYGAGLDLSAFPPGGGRLISAHKAESC